MTKKRVLFSLLLLVLLLPLWMWLAWWLTPKKKMVVAIVDKTVLTPKGQEHISLTWILNHNRFTKTSQSGYKVSNDYFGFFPKEQEQYRLKGLERFTNEKLDQLAQDCQVAYITDAYGIYRNEWYAHSNETERSGIVYGGLTNQDISFLQKMKAAHKLILTEFNSIGSPTSPGIRHQFEESFHLHWTGWTGRYFELLDTTLNNELPRWLINAYRQQHQGKWSFHKAGVAFVHDNGTVAILEQDTHLTDALPRIHTSEAAQRHYGLPASIPYSFWFDIMQPDSSVNTVPATFRIDVNDKGRQELDRYGLPASFPAITQHTGADYQFYYFSADFCDNPVSMSSSFFKGIGFFKHFFYSSNDPMDRRRFFWNYYRPLVTTILKEYYSKP